MKQKGISRSGWTRWTCSVLRDPAAAPGIPWAPKCSGNKEQSWFLCSPGGCKLQMRRFGTCALPALPQQQAGVEMSHFPSSGLLLCFFSITQSGSPACSLGFPHPVLSLHSLALQLLQIRRILPILVTARPALCTAASSSVVESNMALAGAPDVRAQEARHREGKYQYGPVLGAGSSAGHVPGFPCPAGSSRWPSLPQGG